MSRDKLVAYLWPEKDTSNARNRLNQAVHALRKALGTEALASQGDMLALDPELISSDVHAFEDALQAGELERAVSLYKGPFLDGFFLGGSAEFERWAEGERTRLRRAYLGAIEGLAGRAEAAGELVEASEWWRRLADEDPHNSRVVLRLMRVLEAAGNPAGAIQVAEVHTARVEDDLGAKPNPVVLALAERMRGDPAGAPGKKPAPAARRPSVSSLSSPRSTGSPGAGPVERNERADAVRLGASRAGAPAEPEGPEPSVPSTGGRHRGVVSVVAAVTLLGSALFAVVTVFGRDPAPEIRRLAVLPLENLTGDPTQAYFVDGMHDALLTALGQVTALMVPSRQSVLRYAGSDRPAGEIARELGVDALVEGSVFRAGDSVRINVQLIRASPEEHLWAGSYAGPLGEALALQADVAQGLADAVHLRTAPREDARRPERRSVDPAAQEAYLRGVYDLERLQGTMSSDFFGRLIRGAIAQLEEAVRLEPEWAAAHGKLALAYHWLASFDPAESASYYPKSKAASHRALTLDDTEAQGHASLGFVLFMHDWDWTGAERELRRAITLEPSASNYRMLAIYLMTAGRLDESIEHFREAERRDPLAQSGKRQMGGVYRCAGRYDDALAVFQEVDGWEGGGDPALRREIGVVHSLAGRHSRAVEELERAVALGDSASRHVSALAYVLGRAGRGDEARELVRWLDARFPGWSWDAPEALVAVGDADRAVEEIRSLFDAYPSRLTLMRCALWFEDLREVPAVREIARRVGVPE